MRFNLIRMCTVCKERPSMSILGDLNEKGKSVSKIARGGEEVGTSFACALGAVLGSDGDA